MLIEHKLKGGFTPKLKAITSIIIIILAFITVLAPSNTSFLSPIYELYVLYNSFILDSGTIVYIYNN